MSRHTNAGAIPLAGGIEGANRLSQVDSPRSLVVLCHGLGEHSGRYAHVISALNDAGHSVYALDHRGHGLSGGRRGHVMSFDVYAADLYDHIQAAQAAVPGVPWYLVAHSMGGLVAIHYCHTHPATLPEGLVITSPLIEVSAEVPAWKATLGKLMSRYWPTLTMPSGLNPQAVSSDPAEVKAYIDDPLVHDKVTARWFTSMNEARAKALSKAPSMTLPTLVMAAGADALVDVEGAHKFFAALGSQDKTKLIYDGWFHEIFNEPGKAEPIGVMVDWLDAHLK